MIRFQRVSFGYSSAAPVLADIELRIGSGLTLLVGPNGCGKSTFLKLAAGVEKPDSGRVIVQNHDLWAEEVEARRNLAFLPEHPDLTPYASIREIINLVCRLRAEPLGRGEEALVFFGLERESAKTIRELSMGQRRRAVFATCLIGSPLFFLFDEPLEGMDLAVQEKIIDWIDLRLSEGASMIVASHSLPPFASRAGRVLFLSGGRAKLVEPLPSNKKDRLEIIENLAKGKTYQR